MMHDLQRFLTYLRFSLYAVIGLIIILIFSVVISRHMEQKNQSQNPKLSSEERLSQLEMDMHSLRSEVLYLETQKK